MKRSLSFDSESEADTAPKKPKTQTDPVAHVFEIGELCLEKTQTDPVAHVFEIEELCLELCQYSIQFRVFDHHFYNKVSSHISFVPSSILSQFCASKYQSRFPNFSPFERLPSNLPLIDRNGDIAQHPHFLFHPAHVQSYIQRMFQRCTPKTTNLFSNMESYFHYLAKNYTNLISVVKSIVKKFCFNNPYPLEQFCLFLAQHKDVFGQIETKGDGFIYDLSKQSKPLTITLAQNFSAHVVHNCIGSYNHCLLTEPLVKHLHPLTASELLFTIIGNKSCESDLKLIQHFLSLPTFQEIFRNDSSRFVSLLLHHHNQTIIQYHAIDLLDQFNQIVHISSSDDPFLHLHLMHTKHHFACAILNEAVAKDAYLLYPSLIRIYCSTALSQIDGLTHHLSLCIEKASESPEQSLRSFLSCSLLNPFHFEYNDQMWTTLGKVVELKFSAETLTLFILKTGFWSHVKEKDLNNHFYPILNECGKSFQLFQIFYSNARFHNMTHLFVDSPSFRDWFEWIKDLDRIRTVGSQVGLSPFVLFNYLIRKDQNISYVKQTLPLVIKSGTGDESELFSETIKDLICGSETTFDLLDFLSSYPPLLKLIQKDVLETIECDCFYCDWKVPKDPDRLMRKMIKKESESESNSPLKFYRSLGEFVWLHHQLHPSYFESNELTETQKLIAFGPNSTKNHICSCLTLSFFHIFADLSEFRNLDLIDPIRLPKTFTFVSNQLNKSESIIRSLKSIRDSIDGPTLSKYNEITLQDIFINPSSDDDVSMIEISVSVDSKHHWILLFKFNQLFHLTCKII